MALRARLNLGGTVKGRTVAILLALVIILSMVPIVAQPNAAAISHRAGLSNPQELGKLSDSIRRQMERKTRTNGLGSS
jgi:branched-subunit amino acid permease